MAPSGRALAASITGIGVWLNQLNSVDIGAAVELAREIEDLGASVLWISESPGGREPLALAGALLAGTNRLRVATGIMSIWTHPPATALSAAHALAAAHDDRFILGLGVSHHESRPGQLPARPLVALREYLDRMDDAQEAFHPGRAVPTVLAALGPKMQVLAANRTSGMHSFCVTTEHTASARQRLGPEPMLAPEQAVVVHGSHVVARRLAREHVQSRLALTNYVQHFRRLGFTEEDLAGGGSDHLVESLVATGDAETVAVRIRRHLAAGADHVAVHPLGDSGPSLDDTRRQLRSLLPLCANPVLPS